MAMYPPQNPYQRKDDGEEQVALFIDWDNLVISNYADRGTNRPNLDVLINKAQQYGTLVIARAYAEWNNTTDRLEVYKAGIETVYAPVFHADRDLSGQTGRGKSLADPIMVTDCVDLLHLMPSVKTYVMVTGDKDMMPVVRLAKMRGRRVVVIGPDYVANVLQQICDEFVPYRMLLVQASLPSDPYAAYYQAYIQQSGAASQYYQQTPTSQTQPQPQSSNNKLGRRGVPGNRRTTTPAPQIQPYTQVNVPPPPSATPQYNYGAYYQQYNGQPSYNVPVPAVVEPTQPPVYQPAVQAVVPTQPAPVTPQPQAQPVATRPSGQSQGSGHPSNFEEIKELIRNILNQRSTTGRGQMRARDLKEDLLRRMPSFNERRYGFSKFKALLTALESDAVLQMDQIGHILWVSLPGTPRPEVTEEAYDAATASDVDNGPDYDYEDETLETAELVEEDSLETATEASNTNDGFYTPPPPDENEKVTTAIVDEISPAESAPLLETPAPIVVPTQSSVAGPKPALLDVPHYQEVIVLIESLRHRNKWLGYELLLSNVRDYLSKQGISESDAKNQAGSILSRLLSEGVLKMAVEVRSRGARKMRVQVAHLQTDNKAVKYALSASLAQPAFQEDTVEEHAAEAELAPVPDELTASPLVEAHPGSTVTQEMEEPAQVTAPIEAAPEQALPDTLGYFGLYSYTGEPFPAPELKESETPVASIAAEEEEGTDEVETDSEEDVQDEEPGEMVAAQVNGDEPEAKPRPRRRTPLRPKVDGQDVKPYTNRRQPRRPVKVPASTTANGNQGNGEA